MKTSLRWIFHGANVLVAGSGLVLAWMIYLAVPVDQWSVVNHPWQPLFQHAHVVTAPLMIFVFGVVWARHVLPKLASRTPEGKITGLVLFLPTVVMAASGYLLQVAVDPSWRNIWAVLHVVVSFSWLLVFAAHVLAAVVARRREG